jgi:hypothetical protein
MACKRCASERQGSFNGEIALHFPGLQGLDKPIVWVFPKLSVCLRCGSAEFTIPESELGVLAQNAGAEVVEAEDDS